MANPTTAPPSTTEWDSTANPNLQFLCPLLPTAGSPRDLVGNVVSRPYAGYNTKNTGPAPSPVGNGFSVSGIQAARYPFGWSTQGLYFTGRAWGSGTSVASPRTLACVLRHSFLSGANAYMGTINLPIVTLASDSLPNALALQISTSGAVTFGFLRQGGGFDSSGITLSPNVWYALALTNTSATGRLWNVYDYSAQSAASQTSTTAGSYVIGPSTGANNVVLLGDGWAKVDLAGCAILANETWDTGTNTRFQDFYQDPWKWARGTYSPSVSTLVAGGVNPSDRTPTSVTVTASRPTGGASAGVYTYQWHRDTSGPTFTPSGGTTLSGQTGLVCVDNTVVPGTVYYYKCVQSDGTSSITTGSVAGRTVRGVRSIGFVGDSITANATVAQYVACAANEDLWRVTWVQRALGGSFLSPPIGSTASNDAAHSWNPGTFQLSQSGTVSGGAFTLTWRGQTTSAVAYNATPATIRSALEALSTVGAGNVTVATYSSTISTSSPASVTFTGAALPSPVGATALAVDPSGLTGGGTSTCYSLYGTAVAQWLTESVADISVMLGTNDSGVMGTPPATYSSLMSAFVAELVATGFTRVILHQIPYRVSNDATVGNVKLYNEAAAALANGTTIIVGDLTAYGYFASDIALLDGLHPTSNGYVALGFAWWNAIRKIIDPTAIPAGLSRSRAVGGA